MNFSHSYYVVTIHINGEIQYPEYKFDNYKKDLYTRRQEAIDLFFRKVDELKKNSAIKTFRVEFVFYMHDITRDFIDRVFCELEVFFPYVLFEVNDEGTEMFFSELVGEFRRANNKNISLGRVVSVKNKNNTEVEIFDNVLCEKLNIPYRRIT